MIGVQIQNKDKAIDENLTKLENQFGKEYLDGLNERELYTLYKRFLTQQ